jgi:hypothetical protein
MQCRRRCLAQITSAGRASLTRLLSLDWLITNSSSRRSVVASVPVMPSRIALATRVTTGTPPTAHAAAGGGGVVGCYVRRLVMQREGRKNWGTMGCPAQHSSSTSPARCGPTAFVLMMCQHYGLRSAQGYFLGPDRHDGTVTTQWTIWVVSACNPTRVAGTIHPGGEGRGGGGRRRRSDRRGGGGGSRRCRSGSPSSSPIGFPTRSGQRSKRCGSRGG